MAPSSDLAQAPSLRQLTQLECPPTVLLFLSSKCLPFLAVVRVRAKADEGAKRVVFFQSSFSVFQGIPRENTEVRRAIYCRNGFCLPYWK
jgi:hypothetical protein